MAFGVFPEACIIDVFASKSVCPVRSKVQGAVIAEEGIAIVGLGIDFRAEVFRLCPGFVAVVAHVQIGPAVAARHVGSKVEGFAVLGHCRMGHIVFLAVERDGFAFAPAIQLVFYPVDVDPVEAIGIALAFLSFAYKFAGIAAGNESHRFGSIEDSRTVVEAGIEVFAGGKPVFFILPSVLRWEK